MHQSIDSVIQLDHVEKSFNPNNSPALSSLTITFSPGAVIGVVGPDGAGKTTLLRMIAGLLTPTSGSIRVIGIDPVKEAKKLHTILGYMPQKFGLYEDLIVLENLTLYADLHNVTGEIRQRIFERLLQFTDLARFTDRYAGKLSGGMKQKLGLACTLISQPKVLLLDEPGVGVDPISRRELWKIVHELAHDGMIILWSTSYLNEAELCREVLLLNEGKLLYNGIPDKLTKSMDDRCILLMPNNAGDQRKLLQEALHLPQISDGVIQGKYVRLIMRSGNNSTDFLKQLTYANGIITATSPRFEDAFIDLLGGGPNSYSILSSVMSDIIGDETEILIEAQELTKCFGQFTATDQISFQVKRGEIFGLLGPNGAGKSTTFKMLCGLLVPTSGNALVMHLDLKTSSSKVRQHLGYMAQKFSLYGNLSVSQNLFFFSGAYGLNGITQKNKIDTMVSAFNLSSVLNQQTNELPLGFKQRLALACALMHSPDILFLDEPTSGVDPLTRREFWQHINGMVEKGVTVMVTTHFMDEAEYCDRIGLIYRGKLIALGTPDELKQSAAEHHGDDPTMEYAFIKLIERWDNENVTY